MISYFYLQRKNSQQKSGKNGKAEHLKSIVNILGKTSSAKRTVSGELIDFESKMLDTAVAHVVYETANSGGSLAAAKGPKPPGQVFLTGTF